MSMPIHVSFHKRSRNGGVLDFVFDACGVAFPNAKALLALVRTHAYFPRRFEENDYNAIKENCEDFQNKGPLKHLVAHSLNPLRI